MLKRAQEGNRFAGALVAAGVSLPVTPLVWVATVAAYEGRIAPWMPCAALVGGFAILGFLAPRVFTWFLRAVGAIADLMH